MTTLRAHFDGRQIVLDEPVPPDLAPNTPVRVVIGEEVAQSGDVQSMDGGGRVLEELARVGGPGGLPPDFSEQHEHSIKGLPKR